MSLLKRWTYASIASIAFTTAGIAPLAHADSGKPITIGWVAWDDAEISAKLAAKVIEEQTQRPVKLVMAEIGIQFQGLMSESVDVIPMVWLPATHKTYWDKYGSQLEDLGVLYEGRIGWAIPDFIPKEEVSSIEDLNKPGVAEKFDGTILAASPGTSQYVLSGTAIEAYRLKGYKVVPSSEAGMATQFGKAADKGDWAILNAWNPHWMFTRWKMRYLEDPKQVFGGTEQIHMVARQGFKADEPEVAGFLAQYSIPLADLESMQLAAQSAPKEQVIDDYYRAHKPRFAAMFQPKPVAAQR
ncbi:glycine betaine ABC transporter substrate-binding protein [Pseudomonas matsuisoli]|uniref:Glycine/betaine ABC transporter substrate-binding protein n=1 Tax=Pseudomonas matsuisoli TaxID=1515666 RepID=A0A917PY38_9PSED|nr:glycine betaine ABC transporter substrate-binding protein [Pseudomonas matsuisoli]GGJ98378.1 glycine/betaine ABC transporter substrate-binding protein [Pseudomonas matsuisoli]